MEGPWGRGGCRGTGHGECLSGPTRDSTPPREVRRLPGGLVTVGLRRVTSYGPIWEGRCWSRPPYLRDFCTKHPDSQNHFEH